jgi:hypothetical protein
MMGTQKQSSHKKPDRRRDKKPFVELRLLALFDEPPPNEYQLLRPIAERILVLLNSAKLRALCREEFDLEGDTLIEEIPTDSILAQYCEMPLADYRTARDTGRFPHGLGFGESVGRGDTYRTSHEMIWYSSLDMSELEISISLTDVPGSNRGRVIDVVQHFFEAVAMPQCAYAWADFSFLETIAVNPADTPWMEVESRENEGRRFCRSFIPDVHWMDLLSPQHLEKLDGPEPLCTELKALDTGGEARAIGAPIKQFDSGHVLVRSFKHDPSMNFYPKFPRIDHWLRCRFAQAGLLLAQSSEYFELMRERCRKRGFNEDGVRVSILSDKERQAALKAHEDAFQAVMDRVWANPPRCASACAVPLSPRERGALERGKAGDNTTAFWIRRNGSDKPLGIWGQAGIWSPIGEPVLVGGPTKADAAFTFNSLFDGYDGEFGHNAERGQPSRPPEPYHCSRCGHDRFHCQVHFEYSPEPGDYEEPGVAERPQDFFTWITLIGKCAQCDKRKTLFEMECA